MLRMYLLKSALVVCALFVVGLAAVGCGSDDPVEDGAAGAGGPTNTQVEQRDGLGVGSGGSSSDADSDTDGSDGNGDKASQEPPPVQILTGNNTGIRVSKPTVRIVQSEKARSALLKDHFSNGVKRDGDVATTGFDDDRQVVGLFMPQGSRGSFVVIREVRQEGDRIVVSAVELLNGKGCKTTGKKPRPFHIVETRKMKSKESPKVEIEVQRSTEC